MPAEQLTLNLKSIVVDDGKKTHRLTCTCSEEFHEFVDKIARIRKTTVSVLLYEYVLEGMRGDITNIFLPAPHLDKSLRELLDKKF